MDKKNSSVSAKKSPKTIITSDEEIQKLFPHTDFHAQTIEEDLSHIEPTPFPPPSIEYHSQKKPSKKIIKQYLLDRHVGQSAKLEIQALQKRFGRKWAVKNIDFHMHTGEIVGLLGPNGAGKTTAFYMIAGFISPSAGWIYLNGIPLNFFPMYKRAHFGISYLPQEASVFRKLSVKDNIFAVLQTRHDLSKSRKLVTLSDLIERLGLQKVYKQPAYTLSGGERRRTEIARALACNPYFLLLDEPFAGIDPIAIEDIKNIISSLAKQNIGILITDHNVRETLEITDRSYVIYSGEILVHGTRDFLIKDKKARKLYLGENFKF